MMNKKKKYMSDEAFAALEGSLKEALEHARGQHPDLRTTVVQLPPPPPMMDAAQIAALRRRFGFSQSFFARALNVSLRTVQAWEQGARVPSDAALKLLNVVERHPEAIFNAE